MRFEKVIGIGWDVGGWMGSNHGVAICEWNRTGNSLCWRGTPTEITIPQNSLLSLEDLTSQVDPDFRLESLDDTMIVVGIDAPLGFPKALRLLLNGEKIDFVKPGREIDNALAYRYTDQHLYRILGKKPLSASYDRIGNNATVAILHTSKWEKEHNFKLYPKREREDYDNKVMIEVYPALLKERKASEVFGGIKKYMPEVEPGTDAYDASICALYAIAFGTNGEVLPLLEQPPLLDQIAEEGWVYYFNKESIEAFKK